MLCSFCDEHATKCCNNSWKRSCVYTRPARPVWQVRFWLYYFLVTLWLVGVGYTVRGEWHPCGGTQLMNAVHAHFVVPELPPTPHQPSARFCFSKVSLWYRLLSFCYATDDMESRNQLQCSAKHKEPIQRTEKWRLKFFSMLCAERLALHTSMHCLRQWLYHSKMPHASAATLSLRNLLW